LSNHEQCFLLDTNVLSELMREHPVAAVVDWFAKNTRAVMHTSTVTQAEILTGIALLPTGKRRTALAVAAEQMCEQDFAGHCLGFDAEAAKLCRCGCNSVTAGPAHLD
jgi:predicted nucleic acid-binding protein